MNTRAALGAAAAIAMTVTGGVSALFLAVGQTDAAESPQEPVLVEYVDLNGNPISAPIAPEVVYVNADGTPASPTGEYADESEKSKESESEYEAEGAESESEPEHDEDSEYEESEDYEDSEHEESEHQDHEESEHEDYEESDHEDEDYAAAGYDHD